MAIVLNRRQSDPHEEAITRRRMGGGETHEKKSRELARAPEGTWLVRGTEMNEAAEEALQIQLETRQVDELKAFPSYLENLELSSDFKRKKLQQEARLTPSGDISCHLTRGRSGNLIL